MEYLLLHKEETDSYLTIGTDNGFGVFWADQCFKALMNIVENSPDRLSTLVIKTDKNETLSVGEFLERIEKLKVRIQWNVYKTGGIILKIIILNGSKSSLKRKN